MSDYFAKVTWARADNETFVDNKYSRGHAWEFDGGAVVAASESPHIVPSPFSVAANVDPEEALVAALSSCHMLFFLALAGKQKFVVDEYTDNAVGVMAKNNEGKIAMTEVTLRPQIRFSGAKRPTSEELEQLHHQAHEQCFIANSVKAQVNIEGQSV